MWFHIGNFRFSSWISEDLHSLTVLRLFWSCGMVDALLSVKSGDYNTQRFDSFAEHVWGGMISESYLFSFSNHLYYLAAIIFSNQVPLTAKFSNLFWEILSFSEFLTLCLERSHFNHMPQSFQLTDGQAHIVFFHNWAAQRSQCGTGKRPFILIGESQQVTNCDISLCHTCNFSVFNGCPTGSQCLKRKDKLQ